MEPQEEKLEKLNILLRENEISENYDQQDLQKFCLKTNLINFKFMLNNYEFSHLQEQIVDILFSQNKKYILEPIEPNFQTEVPTEVPTEDPTNSKLVLEKYIIEFNYLKQNVDQLQKVKGSFSQKHLKKIKFMNFIQNHPQLAQLQELNIKSINVNVKSQAKLLRTALEIEYSSFLNSTILNCLTTIQTSNNPETVFKSIKNLFNQTIIIDIDQLSRLDQKNKQEGLKLKGQNAIVFVANTGAGKSTTAFAFLGLKMVNKQWKTIKSWIIPETIPDDPEIRKIIAQPSSESATENTTAVLLPQDMKPKKQKNPIYLVDTPGWKQSRSSTRELSNSYGAASAIKCLKSARFVVILSGRSHGNRLQGVVQLIDILNQLFPEYKEVSKSVSFLFNRYTIDQLSNLKGELKDLNDTKKYTQSQKQNLKDIFQDFQQKTENLQDILTFDPLENNITKIKSMISNIIDTPGIRNLQKLYKVGYGGGAKTDIEKKSRVVHDLCIHYFQSMQLQICGFYLNQLKEFQKLLGGNEAPSVIQEHIFKIQNKITSIIDKNVSDIKQGFNKAINNLSISEEDIEKYKDQINKAQRYDILGKHINIPKIKEKLESNFVDKINELDKTIRKTPNEVNKQMINILVLLSTKFQNMSTIEELRNFIKEKLNKLSDSFKQKIGQNDYNGSLVYYNQFIVFEKLNKLIQKQDYTSQQEQIQKIVVEHIKEKHKQILQLTDFQTCSEDDLNKATILSKELKILQKQSPEFLKTIKNGKFIMNLLSSFSQVLNNKAIQSLQKIEKQISQTNRLDAENTKKFTQLYKNIKIMRQIYHIQSIVTKKSKAIDFKILSCTSRQQKNLKKSIQEINNNNFNSINFKRHIRQLNQAALRIQKTMSLCQNKQSTNLKEASDMIVQILSEYINTIMHILSDRLNLNNCNLNQYTQKLEKVWRIIYAFNFKGQTKSDFLEDNEVNQALKEINDSAEKVFQQNLLVVDQIIKNIIEQKKQSDNNKQKYQSLHLRQIDNCLKFLEIQKNTFVHLPQKLKEITQHHWKLVTQIKEWQNYLAKQINSNAESLSSTQSEDPRISIYSLKNIIQTCNLIKARYPYIKKIIQYSENNLLDKKFNDIIGQIQLSQKTVLEAYKKFQNPFDYLSKFMQKCKLLCIFDRLGEHSNSNFSKLEEQCNKKLEESQKNINYRLQYNLLRKRYSQYCQILKTIYDTPNGNFIQQQERLLDHLLDEGKKIKDYKENILQLNNIESIVQLSQSYVNARKAIEMNNFPHQTKIHSMIETISSWINTLSKIIKQAFDLLISEAQIQLKNNNLQNAYQRLKTLQKVENTYPETDIMKTIKNQKLNSLKQELSKNISVYKLKYMQEKQFDMLNFKSDYENIFQSQVTYCQLVLLKKEMDKKINQMIQQKIKQVQKTQNFNKCCKEDVEIFLRKLPKQSMDLSLSKSLISSSSLKYQNWIEQKKKMNDQIEKVDLFKNGELNIKIMEYFGDKQAQPIKKDKIAQQLKKQLKKLLEDSSKLKFRQFLMFICQQTKFKLQKPNNQLDKALAGPISEIYDFNLQKIQNMIEQKFKDLIKSLKELITKENHTTKQFQILAEQFLNLLNECFAIMKNKDYEHIMESQLETKLNSILLVFIEELTNVWITNTQQVNNLKTVLEVTQKERNIKKDIEKVSKITRIEKFVNLYILTERTENSFFKIILQKAKQIKNNQVIPGYLNILKQKLIPIISQIQHYSLSKDMMRQLSQKQIEVQINKTENTIKYFSIVYPAFLRDVMGSDIGQSVTSINSKVNNEASKMRDEVIKFSMDPEFDSQKIQKIRVNIVVLCKCQPYYDNLKSIKDTFDQNLTKYHKQLFEQCQQITTQLGAYTKNNNIILQKTKQNNRTNLQKSIQDRKKILDQKLDKLKLNMDLELKKCEQNKKQEIKTNYQNQVNQQNSLFNQQTKKMENQNSAAIKKIEIGIQSYSKMQLNKVALQLTKMFSVYSYFMMNSQNFKERIDRIILKINSQGKAKWLRFLGQSLYTLESSMAKILLKSYHQLEDVLQSHFKKNIDCLDVKQIIEKFRQQNIMSSNLQKEIISKYNKCNELYQKQIKNYNLQPLQTKNNIITQLKNTKTKFENKSYATPPDQDIVTVCFILTLWSILTSKEQQGNIVYPYKPHPVQIITLILLLGLPDTQQCKKIKNRFAEIKTGQGKSLILAVLSTFFALKKINVDCVCYSEHLIVRDKNYFMPLFKQLGVVQLINYCTFDGLVESFIKNGQLDLRDEFTKISSSKKIEDSFLGKSSLPLIGSKKTYKGKIQDSILLIDQSDVFFDTNFYGNIYTPSSQLRSTTIKKLYQSIWNNRQMPQSYLKTFIQKSSNLKNIIQQFPNFSNLIYNQISHMIHAVKNYRHQYEVLEGKIQYKNQDGYTSKISLGYRTIFAYFYQNQQKKIVELPSLVQGLDISLCQVSFADLPNVYKNIIGVTGTLNNMSKSKKSIMNNVYKISENYITPSVYKTSKRQDYGYKIVNEQQYYQEIVFQIDRELSKQRPILVFFDTINEANRFYNSLIFKGYQKKTIILNEKHNQSQRNLRIARCMQKGNITLTTRAFSRGTDFIIYQQNVVKLGGAHLIVTFIFEEKSEEVQVKGRVGRQGDPCSSIFIVKQQQLLDKLGLISTQIVKYDQKTIQQKIDDSRELKMAEFQKIMQPTLQNCKKKHLQTVQFLSNLMSGQKVKGLQYILKLNQKQQIFFSKPLKIVLAIDATGSMSNAIIKVKESITQMFSRLNNTIRQNSFEFVFEIQALVYRNYNVNKDEILEFSSFEIDPKMLINFIQKITTKGGMGPQALELVYNHCLNTQDLKLLIVISDAICNSKQQTIYNRRCLGQQHWKDSIKYKQPLDGQQLLKKIKQNGILVHSLPITSQSKIYYDRVSKETGGNCQLFSPTNSDASKVLTDFVSTCILQSLGGENKKIGEQLVNWYKATYKA